jgi:hypothetical protein
MGPSFLASVVVVAAGIAQPRASASLPSPGPDVAVAVAVGLTCFEPMPMARIRICDERGCRLIPRLLPLDAPQSFASDLHDAPPPSATGEERPAATGEDVPVRSRVRLFGRRR